MEKEIVMTYAGLRAIEEELEMLKTAVSYTHLDVYKRQAVPVAHSIFSLRFRPCGQARMVGGEKFEFFYAT